MSDILHFSEMEPGGKTNHSPPFLSASRWNRICSELTRPHLFSPYQAVPMVIANARMHSPPITTPPGLPPYHSKPSFNPDNEALLISPSTLSKRDAALALSKSWGKSTYEELTRYVSIQYLHYTTPIPPILLLLLLLLLKRLLHPLLRPNTAARITADTYTSASTTTTVSSPIVTSTTTASTTITTPPPPPTTTTTTTANDTPPWTDL